MGTLSEGEVQCLHARLCDHRFSTETGVTGADSAWGSLRVMHREGVSPLALLLLGEGWRYNHRHRQVCPRRYHMSRKVLLEQVKNFLGLFTRQDGCYLPFAECVLKWVYHVFPPETIFLTSLVFRSHCYLSQTTGELPDS